MKNLYLLLSILLCIVAGLAQLRCSNSDNGSSVQGSESIDLAGAGGSLAELASAENGWISPDCILGSPGSIQSYKIVQNEMILTVKYYDSDCNFLSRENRFTYAINTLGTGATNGDATKLNMKVVKSEAKAGIIEEVNAYNSQTACSRSDWIINTWMDVTSSECDISHDMKYTLFKITNENSLQFGSSSAGHDGSSESLRFINLGTTIFSKY